MASKSPTVRQRELGKRLRELRNGCDLTVEDVAERLLCSATKINGLESGLRRPSLRDVRDLCGLYEVERSTSTDLMSLARGTRETGWWTKYDDPDLNPYVGLEQEASSITSYTMYYVPALLQTEYYAGEIVRTIVPKMDPDMQQKRIEVRLRRQQLLEPDNRPRYRVLMDEAVLHRPVGSPALMAVQLRKVLEAVYIGRVAVQIIPFDVGAHAAQDSNFILFEFDETDLPSVVFVESLAYNQYLDKPTDVFRYREALDYLRDSALTLDASVELLVKMQRAYAGE